MKKETKMSLVKSACLVLAMIWFMIFVAQSARGIHGFELILQVVCCGFFLLVGLLIKK